MSRSGRPGRPGRPGRSRLPALGVAALAGVAAAPGVAAADDPNDLVLARLVTRMTDAGGRVTGIVPQNVEFRSLASQLGVVLAPQLLTPADTLGFGGFQFSVGGSTTQIDSGASYWRALNRSPDPTGTMGQTHGPSSLQTMGFFVRKGMWFPLPSFELGAGAVHIIDSTTWAPQLSAKFALHEGYHDLPLPSLAVRGAVSRMMNQRELDLTTASIDVTLSKHIGVGGTWRLDPYAGWNQLLIVPRSEVLDPTPNVDPLTQGNEPDAMLNFVFKDQATIYRTRVFVGVKLQYDVFHLTMELQNALAGSSIDDRGGTTTACVPTATTTACDSKDRAAAQRTVLVSAGLDL